MELIQKLPPMRSMHVVVILLLEFSFTRLLFASGCAGVSLGWRLSTGCCKARHFTKSFFLVHKVCNKMKCIFLG
eukprot:scaffold22356_cov53-Attheya_sp.AAC.6